MFSYRHAFHAGNHADVLKHTVLIAALEHLLEKEAPLTVVDTHAGAGLYRLDGDYARTSAEATEGVLRLVQSPAADPLAPALTRYLEVVAQFNAPGQVRIYPGSPFIVQRLLRAQDRLKLCELHPSDIRALEGNIAQLEAGRQISVLRQDGFASITRYLPPPSRRALVLCDPSYEIKNDYARTAEFLALALKRFATGVYAVWHPVIPRPEAHALPRRLKTLATRAGKPWLHATLTVKSGRPIAAPGGAIQRPGLPASGVFLVNPPWTLRARLEPALRQLAERLGQDGRAGYVLEASG